MLLDLQLLKTEQLSEVSSKWTEQLSEVRVKLSGLKDGGKDLKLQLIRFESCTVIFK